MDCANIIFSGHAIRRMFERSIAHSQVREALRLGEVIAEYPDDDPLPSFLILGLAGTRSLHVVVAVEKDSKTCYIITAYEPDPVLWDEDLKTRRS
jgi:hypothetical protein